MLTETSRVRGVSAATKSSAVINRPRGETIFSFKPSRSSIGFHVVYCSGNSPFAVITSSPGSQVRACATAATPALAPLVSAISSGFPPISFAIDARIRSGTSKKVESGFWCGLFFASSAACTARMETFGIGDWPAKFKYVASSISNHSCRQSICVEVTVVAMGRSFPKSRDFGKERPMATTVTSTQIDWRQEWFEIEDATYLNLAGQSPMPKVSIRAVQAALEAKKSPHQKPDSTFFEVPDRIRASIAKLIGGKPEEIALTSGASAGVAAVAHALTWEPGDEVITAKGEFPLQYTTWKPMEEREGLKLKIVSPRGRFITADDLVAAKQSSAS